MGINFPVVLLRQFPVRVLGESRRKCPLYFLSCRWMLCLSGRNFPSYSLVENENHFKNLADQLHELVLVPSQSTDRLKTLHVHHLSKYHDFKTQGSSILSKRHIETIPKLTSSCDLLNYRPDKDVGWVIMNRLDYEQKLTTVLPDDGRFM